MRTRVKLTFPKDLVKEPLIVNVAGLYDVVPSIRRARLTESAAEMVLELKGTRQNLGKGIQSLREQGVEVELVEGEMVES